jgi:hypothetical protein
LAGSDRRFPTAPGALPRHQAASGARCHPPPPSTRDPRNCSRSHEVGPRLARWLLMSQDRVALNRLRVTQETLGVMLAVRRVSVTAAAAALQPWGVITTTGAPYRCSTARRLNRRHAAATAATTSAVQRCSTRPIQGDTRPSWRRRSQSPSGPPWVACSQNLISFMNYRGSPLPLRHRLLIDAVTLGQRSQTLLITFYRSTDRLCRRGAPMQN